VTPEKGLRCVNQQIWKALVVRDMAQMSSLSAAMRIQDSEENGGDISESRLTEAYGKHGQIA